MQDPRKPLGPFFEPITRIVDDEFEQERRVRILIVDSRKPADQSGKAISSSISTAASTRC
jgi:hypothetical protein